MSEFSTEIRPLVAGVELGVGQPAIPPDERGVVIEAEYPVDRIAGTTVLAHCLDRFAESVPPAELATNVMSVGGSRRCKAATCIKQLIYDCVDRDVIPKGLCADRA